MIGCINQSRKTSCRLIHDGLFTSWKFGFVFDPRLHNLQLLVLEVFHLVFWFFIANCLDKITFPPPPPPPPPANSEISRTISYRHKNICFSEALEARALQKTTIPKNNWSAFYARVECTRETRNEYCESSRVSLTRQMRLGPKKKPIWRRSGHAEHVCI